jgi:transcriptional regulator with XRE-family HTH domain
MFDYQIMTVGERIKQLRKKSELTQQQLADKVGITYIQIGRYETGKSNASSDILQKVATALNTTADFLMSGGNAQQLTDKELLQQFKEVEQLPTDDKHLIKTFIDAFLTKRKVQKLAQ